MSMLLEEYALCKSDSERYDFLASLDDERSSEMRPEIRLWETLVMQDFSLIMAQNESAHTLDSYNSWESVLLCQYLNADRGFSDSVSYICQKWPQFAPLLDSVKLAWAEELTNWEDQGLMYEAKHVLSPNVRVPVLAFKQGDIAWREARHNVFGVVKQSNAYKNLFDEDRVKSVKIAHDLIKNTPKSPDIELLKNRFNFDINSCIYYNPEYEIAVYMGQHDPENSAVEDPACIYVSSVDRECILNDKYDFDIGMLSGDNAFEGYELTEVGEVYPVYSFEIFNDFEKNLIDDAPKYILANVLNDGGFVRATSLGSLRKQVKDLLEFPPQETVFHLEMDLSRYQLSDWISDISSDYGIDKAAAEKAVLGFLENYMSLDHAELFLESDISDFIETPSNVIENADKVSSLVESSLDGDSKASKEEEL